MQNLSSFHSYHNIPPWQKQIEHKDKLLLIGSCFAHELGTQLINHKIHGGINPFGTLYNPISIAENVVSAIQEKKVDSLLYIQQDGMWKHLSMHGDIAAETQKELEKRMRQTYRLCKAWVKEASWVIITYGTSEVYQHKPTKAYVGNCHKISSSLFDYEMMTSDSIFKTFSSMYRAISSINSSIQYILTVSPVRYMKNGLQANSQSKARLISITQDIALQYSNVHYFPAYEMITDELRDYRFYKQDRIHPNEEAIQYVWRRFQQIALSESCRDSIEQIAPIVKAMQHRISYPKSKSAQEFITKQLQAIENCKKRYSYIDFEKEKAYFTSYKAPS